MEIRHRGIIRLSDADIARMLRLPLGMSIVGVYADHNRMAIDLVVIGNDLPEVLAGCEPPLLEGRVITIWSPNGE